ncbi:MAG: hypothetical protein WC070_00610 [Candidatus Magasanikbacteria bacterium]
MKSTTVLCAFCGKNLSKEDPIIVLKKSKRNNYLAKYNSVLELKKYVFFHKNCYSSNLKVTKRVSTTNAIDSVSDFLLLFIFLVSLTSQAIFIAILPMQDMVMRIRDWFTLILFLFSIGFIYFLFFRAVYILYLVYKYDLFIKTKFLWVIFSSFILGMVLYFATVVINIKSLVLNSVIGSLGIAFICLSIVWGHLSSFKIKE